MLVALTLTAGLARTGREAVQSWREGSPVLAAIAEAGQGVLLMLSEAAPGAEALLARIRNEAASPTPSASEWRRNGAGSQILADLGYGKLKVLGTPRKQVGLAGFGLEVVEYVALPPR